MLLTERAGAPAVPVTDHTGRAAQLPGRATAFVLAVGAAVVSALASGRS